MYSYCIVSLSCVVDAGSFDFQMDHEQDAILEGKRGASKVTDLSIKYSSLFLISLHRIECALGDLYR